MARPRPIFAPIAPPAPTAGELCCEGVFRVRDAAAFMGLSTQHVRNLMRRGVLPVVRVGRATRIPRRAVTDFLAAHLSV